MILIRIAIYTGTIILTEDTALATYIIETLKYLIKKENLEIILIAPYNIPDELKGSVEYVPYKVYNKLHFRYLSTIISSFHKISLCNSDVLHCFGHSAASIALISRKKKRENQIIISHLFGLSSSELKIHARYSLKSKIFEGFNSWKEKVIIEKSDGLTTLSESMKEYLMDHNGLIGDNIFVAPIGINIEKFNINYYKNTRIVDTLKINGKKSILYIGWISALHGVLDLIKAINIINNIRDDVVLVIVGDGPLESLVKKYISENKIDNIVFTGKVPHKEIQRYYSIADVLIIPHVKSLQTELNPSTKVLECLASGKPIVASNLKPIAEIIGDCAILVEPENPQSIAEGILQLLSNEELGQKLSERGKKIIENHSWETIGNCMYEAYANMCDIGRRH